MKQRLIHLRSLHVLSVPGWPPSLVTMRKQGILIPICLEELVLPMRTWFPELREASIPDLTDFC